MRLKWLVCLAATAIVGMVTVGMPEEAGAVVTVIDVCGEHTGGPFNVSEHCLEEPSDDYAWCGVCQYYCPDEEVWLIPEGKTMCVELPIQEACYNWHEVCDEEAEWFYLHHDYRDVLWVIWES